MIVGVPGDPRESPEIILILGRGQIGSSVVAVILCLVPVSRVLLDVGVALSVMVVPVPVAVGHGVHDEVAEGVVAPPSARASGLVTEQARRAIAVRVNLAPDLQTK